MISLSVSIFPVEKNYPIGLIRRNKNADTDATATIAQDKDALRLFFEVQGMRDVTEFKDVYVPGKVFNMAFQVTTFAHTELQIFIKIIH